MKPRLVDDVHFVPCPDGVFVMVASRPDLGFVLRGRQTHEWLTRMAPFLTGEHALDDLVDALDEARRERIRSLVEALHSAGAVRDAAADLPHSLSADIRERYAQVIGFVGRSADSPEHRFQRYRECRPVVVGSGQLVAPLVQALLTTGVAEVRVVLSAERPTDLGRMRQCLALVGPDAQERVRVGTGALTDAAVTDAAVTDAMAAACGGILHVCETPMLARGDQLAALGAAHGRVFGQAAVVGDVALVGPVGGAGQMRPGWAAQLGRLVDGHAGEVRDRPDDPVSEYLAGPTAAVVANHLCAAFLKQVTGLPTGAAEQFVEVDLETLRAAVRPVAATAALAGEVAA
jgi:hypothetical protein